MYPLQQGNLTQELVFLMTDSVDHISPKTGLAPTVLLRKNGAAFGAPAGAVTEDGHGWYSVAANAVDANTLGPLILHAEAAGADPQDLVYTVVSYDPLVALGRIDANVTGLKGLGVVFSGPVAPGGTVSIQRGYSYESATGTALQWTSAQWPSLAGATLQLWDDNDAAAIGSATFSAGGGSQTVTVQITSAQSAALTFSNHAYILRALFGSESVALAEGILGVRD